MPLPVLETAVEAAVDVAVEAALEGVELPAPPVPSSSTAVPPQAGTKKQKGRATASTDEARMRQVYRGWRVCTGFCGDA